MSGKCSKCDKLLNYAKVNGIDLKDSQSTWQGVAYTCPFCGTIISVQADPLLLVNDTINGVKQLLGK